MNKYRNIKTEYNGFVYDSQLEVIVAQELDLLMKAGQIVSYVRQMKLNIIVESIKIGFYKADFIIAHLDKSLEIIECKGVWTSTAKLKMKLIYVLYPKHKITIRQRHQSYTFTGKFIK